MKIAPIKFNLAFRGEKDENQPLSDELKKVFSDKSVPTVKKKLLWELSEVPCFYEASKDLTKDEFIKLSDFIQKQDTNVLEMALLGDVRVISRSNDEEGRSLFKFAPLVKYNKTASEREKIGIIDYIKNHPIFKVANDVISIFNITNSFPKFINYQVEKDSSGHTKYTHISPMEAYANMVASDLFTGNPYSSNNAVIIFKKNIEDRSDYDCGYVPVNPETIEKPCSESFMPENIERIFSASEVDSKIKESVYELSKIPYFKNLVRYTSSQSLVRIGEIDSFSNRMLSKILTGEVIFEIFNPKTKKESGLPIIDVGKILSDRKTDLSKQTDLLSILSKDTLAIETCILYNSTKEILPDRKIKSLILKKSENGIIQETVTDLKETVKLLIPNEAPLAAKILSELDKFPYKKLKINFNEK